MSVHAIAMPAPPDPALVIDRLPPARLDVQRLEAAVVIDVLRATSTAAVILARGVPFLWVAPDLDALRVRPSGVDGELLVFSEIEAVAEYARRVDNSPTVALEVELDGRVPVLLTTNGTSSLRAAADRASGPVLIASFLNLNAVAAWLRQRAPGRITLLPAGRFDRAEIRAEDELCADALEELLAGRSPDLPDILGRLREDERVQRRIATQPGFHQDVELALSVDHHPIVAGVVPADVGPDSSWLRLGSMAV